jgi:hypothetical protein
MKLRNGYGEYSIGRYVSHTQCGELVDQILIGVHCQIQAKNRDDYNDYGDNRPGHNFEPGVYPDEWKRYRPEAQQCKDNGPGREVPLFRSRLSYFPAGSVEKLAAVPALDCLGLNLLGTKWAFLHAGCIFGDRLVLIWCHLFCTFVCG